MLNRETVGVCVNFKEPVTFHLRIVSVSEETKLRDKLFGSPEQKTEEISYQNNVDMLADLSEKMPEGLFQAEDQSEKSPAEVVREYFADKTIIKERLATYAVRGYFACVQPTVTFQF